MAGLAVMRLVDQVRPARADLASAGVAVAQRQPDTQSWRAAWTERHATSGCLETTSRRKSRTSCREAESLYRSRVTPSTCNTSDIQLLYSTKYCTIWRIYSPCKHP